MFHFHNLRHWAAIFALLPTFYAAENAIAQKPPPAKPATRSEALPALGDAGIMTPPEERRLGDLIAQDLYSDTTYMDDPIISEYIDSIWRQLLQGEQVRGEITPELASRLAWRFALLRNQEINAFAIPGGYMGLNLGLIGAVASRDELAAVVAHEMSHITQRHIARMIATQGRETPLILAAMIVGVLAGINSPQVGSAVLAGGQAAMAARQLSYSRDMEREADRIGYGVFVQSEFAPWGFVSMFEKLQDASRLNDNGDWPLLRSHPLTTERIADMQERQRSLQGRPRPQPDWETLLIAARARVLAKPNVDVLRNWIHVPETPEFAKLPPEKRAAGLYAAAMSQAALRDYFKAQNLAALLDELTDGQPQARRQVKFLQAELALSAGQPQRALQLLSDSRSGEITTGNSGTKSTTTLEINDANANAMGAMSGQVDLGRASFDGRAQLLLRTAAQLQAGQLSQIKSTAADLQAWVSMRPNDALAWQYLAQANRALGQELRALRAEGEVRMANLDYSGAIDRWRAAQDYSRKHQSANQDLIDASIVNSRLQVGKDALKRQKDTEKKFE